MPLRKMRLVSTVILNTAGRELADFSEAGQSPWKQGGTGRLANGIVITQAEFDSNYLDSAAHGQSVGNGYCTGALVSPNYYLQTGYSNCIPPTFVANRVYLGSIYFYTSSSFDGQQYAVLNTTVIPGFVLYQIASVPSSSKAKPAALPPASLQKPPPVGSNCSAFSYEGDNSLTLNRLPAVIVDIAECQTRWTKYNSAVVVPQDGSVFCAWITSNGTAEGTGSVCGRDGLPTVICGDWTPPKPTPPSCGWHGRAGGSKIADGPSKNQRSAPLYFLAGISGETNFVNCGQVRPPSVIAYAGLARPYVTS